MGTNPIFRQTLKCPQHVHKEGPPRSSMAEPPHRSWTWRWHCPSLPRRPAIGVETLSWWSWKKVPAPGRGFLQPLDGECWENTMENTLGWSIHHWNFPPVLPIKTLLKPGHLGVLLVGGLRQGLDQVWGQGLRLETSRWKWFNLIWPPIIGIFHADMNDIHGISGSQAKYPLLMQQFAMENRK